jgi:DNA-binding NtrC family response regulator
MGDVTQSESRVEAAGLREPVPGVLLVFSDHAPQYRPVTLRRGGKLTLGREDVGGVPIPDGRVGRAHAEVSFEGGQFTVADLASRNGTFIDGARIEGTVRVKPGAVLRLAQTVLLLHDDLQRFITGQVRVEDGFVVGPGLQEALDLAALARRGGMHLLVHGETGSGKELVAHTFHQADTPRGPFVAVNSATIQSSRAEGALFGALAGAYTDLKKDLPGHFDAAKGGVLFLDEIADIALEVQAKLLRAAQNGEVQTVGAATPHQVDVQIVSASHFDLRSRVAEGLFREDLLYRLATSEVSVRPLRERREEVPWLMQHALGTTPPLPLHATVVEAALLRRWPGNVRELISETSTALLRAQAAGSTSIRAENLRADAGMAHGRMGAAGLPGAAPPAGSSPGAPPAAAPAELTKEQVVAALEAHQGNVSAAARALGVYRNQLNRLRKRHGLMGAGEDEND